MIAAVMPATGDEVLSPTPNDVCSWAVLRLEAAWCEGVPPHVRNPTSGNVLVSPYRGASPCGTVKAPHCPRAGRVTSDD